MEILDLGIFFTIVCVASWFATWLIRKGTYILFPQWGDESNKWEKIYKEVILPALPALLGGFICLFDGLPYPEALGASQAAHVLFGVFCGFCSAYVVRVVKSQLKSKLGETEVEKKIENKIDEVVAPEKDPTDSVK